MMTAESVIGTDQRPDHKILNLLSPQFGLDLNVQEIGISFFPHG